MKSYIERLLPQFGERLDLIEQLLNIKNMDEKQEKKANDNFVFFLNKKNFFSKKNVCLNKPTKKFYFFNYEYIFYSKLHTHKSLNLKSYIV